MCQLFPVNPINITSPRQPSREKLNVGMGLSYADREQKGIGNDKLKQANLSLSHLASCILD